MIGGNDASDECDAPPCDGDDPDGGSAGGDGGQPPGGDGATPLGDFTGPALVEALSDATTSEGDPSVTEDALELYFSSDRLGGGGGGVDLFVSRRESPSDDWGEPQGLPELNSADADFDPEVSADGLTMWLASNRVVASTKGAYDLFVSTRETRDDDWSTPQVVPVLNSADSDMGAVMNEAKTVLVFHRVTSGGAYDLFQSTRETADDAWSDPDPITGINTADQEADAYLSRDGLTLFFNSTRPDGTGGSDIWMATRQTATSLFFTVPEEVAEVNTDSHEANCGLGQDLRYIVLSSSRSGDHEIYESSR